MSRRGSARAALVAGALACGLVLVEPVAAKRAPEPDPFLVSADSLAGRMRVVAVAPTNVPAELGEAADAAAAYERAIAESLAASGFAIVPVDSVRTIWNTALREGGGIFDPRTGKKDPARFEKVRGLAVRALREQHHADAWLRPSFVVVAADFEGGEAKWDGVTRKVGGDGFLNTVLLSVPEGRTAAVSLEVAIDDLDGRSLYRRRTGIQARTRLGKKDQSVDIPTDELFSVEDHRRFAVERTLRPWRERVKPAGAPPP